MASSLPQRRGAGITGPAANVARRVPLTLVSDAAKVDFPPERS
jgi:hypothetical protein